jgi:hypothetical protein
VLMEASTALAWLGCKSGTQLAHKAWPACSNPGVFGWYD